MTDNEHALLLRLAAILAQICRTQGRLGQADSLDKLAKMIAEESAGDDED